MARMPKAEWQGEQSPRRLMSRYDILCLHTIVGFAPAHAAHFSTRGSGKIIQSRDTRFQSGANLEGNRRVIAVENEDHGPDFPDWTGSNVPPFTAEQIESCAEIFAWAHKEHGIPLQLCPDSRPGSRGLAFHRQGIDGNFPNGRVPGGEIWTTTPGKVCPGDRRIAQRHAVLARAIELVHGDEMTLNEEDRKWLSAELDARFAAAADAAKFDHDGDPKTAKMSVGNALRSLLWRSRPKA